MNASAQTAEGSSDRTSNVGITFGTGYSDNVFQAGGGGSSGNYKALGFVADIDRETRRFRGIIESDLAFRDYSNSRIDDEPWGRFDMELELRAVPDRFSWMVINNYAEGTTDPFLATGPLNRQQINVFETGPAVYLPLGQLTEFRVTGLAGERSFDDSLELDSETTTATAGVFREINSTTELGFSVSSRDVEYDLTPAADNTIDAAYFSYAKQLASGAANVTFGINEVDYATLSNDAPFFDIAWNREVGRRSNLAFRLLNRYIDAGEQFRGRGDDSRDTVLVLDVFEEQSAAATLSVDGSRTTMAFGVTFSKDRYQRSNEFDNDTFGLSFDYGRDITQLMEFNAQVQWNDRDFTGRDDQFQDRRLSLGIQRAFSRKLALSAQWQYTDRGGDGTLFSFDENQLTIQIRYDLNPSATPDPF